MSDIRSTALELRRHTSMTGARFDEVLAAHDAQVRAEALDVPMMVAITPEALMTLAATLNSEGVGACVTVETVDGKIIDIVTPTTHEEMF